ncbi:MAG: Minf_1886 family protein [Deltaproteobacteria bacterium]
MEGIDFRLAVEQICARDARYKPDGYEFVMQVLGFTQKKLKRAGHVSGRELAEGARELAIKLYGPMAKAVLNHWGISRTSDLGVIVFNLIESKVLSKTDEDSAADFDNVYDFDNAFKPVLKDLAI